MKKKIISIFALVLCVCLLFSGCESITSLLSGENETIDYEIKDGEATVIQVPNKSTMTVINIPDEIDGVPVTKIADYSTFNLEYATEINIGKNVKEIGCWSMTNNQHVTAFNVSEENESFCSVDGVLYTKDMKTLLFYPVAKDLIDAKDEDGNSIKISEYTIPDGVVTIRSKAFYKCGYLTKVDIPQSVKNIEEKAFFRCGALKEIILPEALENIGKDTFGYCYGLTEITIPSSIKSIGEYAFYSCTNLLKVTVNAKETDLKLGQKWYPTNNGVEIKELEITWKK